MNKEQLNRYISESTGTESNICQIYAIKDNEVVLDDCWHGFRTPDAMNVNSVTKGVVALLAGIALDKADMMIRGREESLRRQRICCLDRTDLHQTETEA